MVLLVLRVCWLLCSLAKGYGNVYDSMHKDAFLCRVAFAAVNMFFQFRYAGGLYQYWVILLSYPLGKLTELFPRGRILNPGPFLAKVWHIMQLPRGTDHSTCKTRNKQMKNVAL